MIVRRVRYSGCLVILHRCQVLSPVRAYHGDEILRGVGEVRTFTVGDTEIPGRVIR